MLSKKMRFSLASFIVLFAVALLLPPAVDAALTWDPATQPDLEFSKTQSLDHVVSRAGGIEDLSQITYSIAPDLPTGLTLIKDIANYPRIRGTVTVGSPTTAYTLTASAQGETSITQTFNITVHSQPVFSSEVTPAEQVGRVGQAFNLVLPAATQEDGDTTSYTLTGRLPHPDNSIVALPAGLTFTAATRTLAGTPTEAALIYFTYTAVDSGSHVSDRDAHLGFTLVILTADGERPPVETPAPQTPPQPPTPVPTVDDDMDGDGNGDGDPDGDMPTGVVVEPGPGKITVTWTGGSATGYEYSTDGGVNWVAVSAYPLVIRGAAGIPISVRIRSTPAGTPSAAVSGEPGPKESQVAPVGVAAVAGDGRITVTWTDGTSGNVSLYEYKKDTDDWVAVSVYPLAILGVNGTAITVRIRLKATLEKLAGEPSEPVTETPRATPTQPTFSAGTVIANQMLTVGTAMPALTLPMATGTGITYSLTPALPAGLTFTPATRLLSGTPTTAMTATTYTYTATNSSGSAMLTFTLTVNPREGAPVLPAVGNKTYTAGTAVSETLPAVTSGTGVTYTLTPASWNGLAFTATTRVLSGTPAAAMSATTFTYTAENSAGRDTETFTITVGTVPAPTFSAGTVIANQMLTVGVAMPALTLPMATGTGITYSLTPALPAGLMFTTATRLLSGTPTTAMAATTYTYTATNSGGNAQLTFTLTVNPPPTDVPVLPIVPAKTYTVGMAVSETLPMATGTGVTYSLAPAAWNGLAFNATTRLLSGTPAAAMSATTFTYTAENSAGRDTKTFTITVGTVPAPTFSAGTVIANQMLTVGVAMRAIELPMATGTGITYSLTPALPAGLAFTAGTRLLSGTPTGSAMAATTFTYTATNSSGNAQLMFTLTVTDIDNVIPSKGFGVLVHSGAMASDTGIASGVNTIPVSNMADLMDFFLNGGTIIVKGPAGAAVGDLKITEIMAAKDATLGGRSKYSQWIEVYNKTGSDIIFDGSRWMLDFRQGGVPEPAGVSSSAAGRVDLVSNMGNPGFWAIPSKGGRSEATTAANAENLVSMYRKLKQFNTANTGHADHAKDDGDPERSGTWVASGRPSRNLGGNRLGTPGTYPVAARPDPTVLSQEVLINEIGNSSSDANDWVELRNITTGEMNLRKWELTLVMSVDGVAKETELVSFPDNDNVKLAAGGILLISNSDPTASGNDLAAGVAINKAAADRVKRGVQSMYYIDSKLVLPNSGKYNLILRSANDKEGKSTHIVDHGGTYFAEKKEGSFDTEVWPLQLWAAGHGNVIDGADEDFRAGLVYKRNGKNSGIGEKHWAKVGFTGIGYDRTAAKTDENGGTPGYANDALKEKVADLSDAEVAISEIMFSAGSGRRSLPQWIELYNSSLTQGVNLNGWQLEIQNARDENLDARQNATITLGAVTIAPNQTVLIVSTSGSNSGRDHFPDTRTIDLWTSHRTALDMEARTDTVLSPTGFYLKLTDKDKKLVDEVGNTDGDRRTNDAPEWALPMGINSDGHRASIIRRYEGRKAEDGMDPSGWISAQDTGRSAEGYSETTYYGDKNDVSTPGHHGGGPLPVSLASFRPARDTATGQVVIRWTTESELNNAGFNILRSETKTGTFTVVNLKGIIPGHGTTAEKHAYTWTDTSAKPNVVYYYQIEDVALDGTRTTLRTTHLRGNVNAAGKLTTTWGDVKTQD